MSVEFWDEQPVLFTLADDDILLAIDDTDNTSKQFSASILKSFTQTPWQQNINAASFNLSNLDVLTFALDTGAITNTDTGLVRVSDGLKLNVGNILDDYTLDFNGTTIHTFTNTTYTAPTILADALEIINAGAGTNPTLTSNSANQDLSLTGRLGLGILIPASPLHLFEDTNNSGANAGFTLENAGGGDAILHFEIAALTWTMGIDNSDADKFKISNNDGVDALTKLTIQTDGNLGIGITTPASPLHVFEDTTTDAAETGITVENQGVEGDAIIHYIISATSWTAGVNNSDEDKFEISNSADLDTNVRLSLRTTGQAGINLSNPNSFLHVKEDTTNTGITGGLTIEQADTTNVGDSLLHFLLTNDAQTWTMGVDNSDSESFKIGVGVDLTTTTALSIATSGVVTIPNLILADITVDQITFDNAGTGGDPILLSNSSQQDLSLTGSLGIGIVDPASPLHVFESTNNTGLSAGVIIEQGGGGDPILHFVLTGVQDWTMGVDNNQSDKFIISSSIGLDTLPKLTILTDGNIGMGTMTPASPLHLFESTSLTNATTGLTIENAGTGDTLLHFLQSTSGSIFWTMGIDHDANDKFIITNDEGPITSNFFTILTNGKIGMGEPTPLTALHITEDNAATQFAGITMQQEGAGDSVLHFDVTGGEEWSIGIDNTDGDLFKISNALDLETNAFFTIDTLGNITMTDITVDQITFKNASTGGDPILLSNSTNQDLELFGSLGIGTTTPATLLHIDSTMESILTLQVSVFGATAATQYVTTIDTYTMGILAVGDGLFILANGTELTSNIAIGVDGTRVGIGTDGPRTQLHIGVGDATTFYLGALDGLAITNDGIPAIIFEDTTESTNDKFMAIQYDDQGLKFSSITDSGSFDNENILVVNRDGNVGIGITTPASPLHVFEDTNNTGLSAGIVIEQDGGGDPLLHYVLTGGQAWTIGVDNNDFQKFIISSSIGLDTEPRFTIETDGNIGIGTINPLSTLDVQGTLALKRTASAIDANTGSEVIIGITDTTVARAVTIDSVDILNNRIFIIKDESGGAATNNIIIKTGGSETIDGASEIVINANYGSIRLYSDGNNLFSW